MAIAMFMVGLLFGVTLAVTLALFGVLTMDGRFTENLLTVASACRDRLSGRHARAIPVAAARSAESDARLRSLQEEIRVQQRLLEQSRTEQAGQAEELRRAQEEITSLRVSLAEGEQQLGERETAMAEATAVAARAREELAECSAQLARSRREVRDLETELDVARSGARLGAFPDEVA